MNGERTVPSARHFLVIASLLLGDGAYAASLFDDIGGEAKLARVVDSMVARSLADPRIRDVFDNTNIDRFTRHLNGQLCEVAGGSCRYTGQTMAGSHAHLGLRMRDMNAVVEHLRDAMEENGVPFRVQNRLLALLAPMQRDIVTK